MFPSKITTWGNFGEFRCAFIHETGSTVSEIYIFPVFVAFNIKLVEIVLISIVDFH